MSIVVRNLLKSVIDSEKLNILTIPSDPVFDHLWSLSSDNIYLYVGNNQTRLLPNVNIIDSPNIGLNIDGFDCLVGYETEFDQNLIENASKLHIPLIAIGFSENKFPCSCQINIGEKIQSSIITYVRMPYPDLKNRISGDYWLCRHDSKFMLEGKVQTLAIDPYSRYEQYKTCKGLINFHRDFYIPELEECAVLGIPCYTVSNKFHKNIPTFSNISELSQLTKVYNRIDMSDYISRTNIFEEIHEAVRILKGLNTIYVH